MANIKCKDGVLVMKIYGWTVTRPANYLRLVEDIPLCLSIILKWNKLYTLSNTSTLSFINLNNGHYLS